MRSFVRSWLRPSLSSYDDDEGRGCKCNEEEGGHVWDKKKIKHVIRIYKRDTHIRCHRLSLSLSLHCSSRRVFYTFISISASQREECSAVVEQAVVARGGWEEGYAQLGLCLRYKTKYDFNFRFQAAHSETRSSRTATAAPAAYRPESPWESHRCRLAPVPVTTNTTFALTRQGANPFVTFFSSTSNR